MRRHRTQYDVNVMETLSFPWWLIQTSFCAIQLCAEFLWKGLRYEKNVVIYTYIYIILYIYVVRFQQ